MTNSTILMVDNDDISQEVSRTVLGRLGFAQQADFARNGEEAIKLYANNKYALIFMGLFFQGMDGFNTAKTLKKMAKVNGNDLTLVALTVQSQKLFRKKSLDSGMDIFISKPLTVDLLEKTLNRIMRMKHPR